MMGELEAARALQREVVVGLTQVLGVKHMETLLARAELGSTLLELGRLAEAEAELLPAIAGFTGQLAADHRIMIDLRCGEARLRLRQGRLAEAQGLLGTLLALAHAKHGPRSVNVGLLGMTLGQALLDAKAAAEAEAVLQDSLIILEQLVPDDANTVNCALLLATAIVTGRGEVALARAVLTRTRERVLRGVDSGAWIGAIDAMVLSFGLPS